MVLKKTIIWILLVMGLVCANVAQTVRDQREWNRAATAANCRFQKYVIVVPRTFAEYHCNEVPPNKFVISSNPAVGGGYIVQTKMGELWRKK